MTTTWLRLAPVFRQIFDDEELTIGAATTADDVEGWDSLAHIRLMIAIEQEFRIRFSAVEISKLRNVGELAALIEKKAAV